ncbi:hypothetical protein K470DRAFT_219523, partial [Piedraia hortae CBS 480.64]
EEHSTYVEEFIKRLGESGLQLDIKKSEVYAKKTKYLNLIISTDGLSMDPEKDKTVEDGRVSMDLSGTWFSQIKSDKPKGNYMH